MYMGSSHVTNLESCAVNDFDKESKEDYELWAVASIGEEELGVAYLLLICFL
jgi:hypothetical protein